VLRNRLYMGEIEWKGGIYAGKHEPLVSRDLWERAQHVLDGRHAKKHRRVKHDFAFSGLIACGHCGCSMVGEVKKDRYVYYHCTGYKGRCDEPYVRIGLRDLKMPFLKRHQKPILMLPYRPSKRGVRDHLGWHGDAATDGNGPWTWPERPATNPPVIANRHVGPPGAAPTSKPSCANMRIVA
jgi:hypothetical protein